MIRLEVLADPVCLSETVEACCGEQNRIDMAFGEFAQTRVYVAAKFNSLDVGPRASSCARRRWLLVPMSAPFGRAARPPMVD